MTEFALSPAELFEADFFFQMKDNPEFASQAGQHEMDHLLQDLSPQAFHAREDHNHEVLRTARAMLKQMGREEEDKDNKESSDLKKKRDQNRLHLELLMKNIEVEQRGYALNCHLYPVNSIGYGGVHNNFLEALDWLGEENKASNFLSRLAAFPRQCEQYKELLMNGVEKKCVASVAMVRKVPEQLLGILAALDNNSGPICDLINSIVPDDKKEEAEQRKNSFRAAVADLLEFFERSYIPHARPESGCRGMLRGNGAEVYAHCLKYHTTTIYTPAEVHAIGIEEVARISRRYQEDVMDKLKFEGSFSDFVKHCQSQQSQYYKSSKQLMEGYEILNKRIASFLPSFFERLPASPFEMVELHAETAPAAFYMQGTVDLTRPGKFYVNVSNVDKRPIYNMTALALHEAMPGHHLQGSLAIENPSIPSFLRFIEDRRYEFCPARRNIYASYLEGWALYCEALGEEMPGLYATPMSLFGRLSMEMMRAVRLVVDTGIHWKGWSVEHAVEYMMANTGMHRHECEAECYRYEAWPGQACAYKIGEVAIWKMRRKAEESLGDRFDIKKFHTCLLQHGPMPLDTLEKLVDEWIDKSLNQS